MKAHASINNKILQELALFEKNLSDLRMLKEISKDLQKFKKMIQLKKFD